MNTVQLTPTQTLMLSEVVLNEIARIEASDVQYKGQIISTLRAIYKKVQADTQQ